MVWDARNTDTDEKTRGFAAQRHRRAAEQTVRKASVAFCRWAGQAGAAPEDCAARLRVSVRTLARWRKGWSQDRLAPRPRGRPIARSDRAVRQQVIEEIVRRGPGIGVNALNAIFFRVPRREVASILGRCRKVYLYRRRHLAHVLHWTRPGAVWAMDFTHPCAPVDGAYRRLLMVCDAASGYEPLAEPAQAGERQVASRALEALFREHGAPLVVKSDNDSAFRAAPTQETLSEWRVFSLLSPAGIPQYNGTREARIGTFKARVCWEAERNGHAGQWTSGDVEAARAISNQTPRRYQDAYIAPRVLWGCRVPISQEEREAFAGAVQACRQEAYSHYGLAADAALTAKQKDDVDRFAVSRALVALGYLSFTRRRITPPFKSVFRARIR